MAGNGIEIMQDVGTDNSEKEGMGTGLGSLRKQAAILLNTV